MLRVGLTGELASGKSTVARMLAARGAVIFSSDDMAREMMQPAHAVFDRIVSAFGSEILTADSMLDRRKLAALAFDPASPRIAELNAIIHPPVLAAQAQQLAALAATQPNAVAVVESALILSVADWRDRFDTLVVVTAPLETKIARFLARAPAATEVAAQQRLAMQSVIVPTDAVVIVNNGDIAELERRVGQFWNNLKLRTT